MSDLDATPGASAIAPGPPAFHLLAKPTGATCNLDCAYCFFLSKEMLYPGSRFRMADELLEQYIRQLIEAHRIPHVTIAWQGGEPTMMGVDFFRRATAYVEKHRRPGMTVEYTIQTNGTLIDDELAAFFKEHDYLVGISIDGPPAMHDAYRVDRGGAPTFERVRRGLERLQAHGVEYNTLTTLHRANADHPVEVYRFLRDECGSRFMQFIPIIERLPAPRIDVPLAELGLAPGLAQAGAVDLVARPAALPPGGEPRHRPLGHRRAVRLVPRRRLRGVGPPRHRRGLRPDVRRRARQLARRAADAVHPLRDLRHRARPGAQRRPLLVRPLRRGGVPARQHRRDADGRAGGLRAAARASGSPSATPCPRYCRECDVRFACHGGCPKDRFIETPDGEPGLNYLCAGYKAFFHHVDRPMRMMSDLLRRGRAPSELVGWYAAEDARLRAAAAKAGRNDPCPCGSGRKVKHCHGAAT